MKKKVHFLLMQFFLNPHQNTVKAAVRNSLLLLVVLFASKPAYSQCSCASPITTTTTIASGNTGCISANSSVAITVNGTLLITGTTTTVSNITLGSGGIVEICGTGNTITFNTIANTSQILVDASGTGNTITQLNQSGGTLTLTNNLSGSNALTIGTATVNSVTLVSFSNSGSGNTFVHAGTGTTNMTGGIQGPSNAAFIVNVTGGNLNLGADGNGRSVDAERSNGGSANAISISAGAKLNASGCIDYGSNVNNSSAFNNQGVAVIGANANGWSLIKRSGNNDGFTNGSTTNSNAILIMSGGIDISGNNGTYTNYGSWSVGTGTGTGADGVSAGGGLGFSVNGNKPSQVFTNNSTGTWVFASGFKTGGGTAWTLTNLGVMSIGRNLQFNPDRNVSISSGDFMSITNGSASFPNATLTITGAIFGRSTNTFAFNNYGCATIRNICLTRYTPATVNLFGGSNLNFTGSNVLTLTGGAGASSSTVTWNANTEVARGDYVNTGSGTLARIETVLNSTSGQISTDATSGGTGVFTNGITLVTGTYNTVYPMLSTLGANSFSVATTTSPSGAATIQLSGLGAKSGNVTRTGTGTLTVYRNGTTNTITSATTDNAGANPSLCAAMITASNTLTALNTCQGTASSSGVFSVAGINMTAGILVTPPAGFEVCLTSGGTYTSTVTVGAAGGIAPTLVYVRLASATSAGTYSGNIALSSSGAGNVNVATVSSVVASSATVALSSPSGDLAAASGSTCANAVSDPVFNFQLAVTVNPGILNQVNFTTTGTHTATDITNYKLWYNASSNSLTGATQIGSTITTATGAGSHSFTGLTQSMSVGSTGYFIITADIASGAVATHTIQVSQLLAANVVFQCSGTVSGSTTSGGAGVQTVSSTTLAVTPTSSLNPAYYGNSITLSAGVTGASGSQTYSWSSVPAFFSGTASTSTATVTPIQNTIVATVLVKDGYCVKSGSITETVSIPYQGMNIINNVSTVNGLAVNLPPTTGYPIPGTIYTYNFNTGTATALNTGVLDYAETGNGGSNTYGRSGVATEANGGTGIVYNVANTATGEFLAYTVNIANAGTYNVTFNVANGNGAQSGQFKLQLDGVDIATTPSSITTANNGWTTFTAYTVTASIAVTGIHTLKLVETGGNFNISTIAFTCPPSTAAVLSPSTATICSGSTVNLSAAITGGSSPFTLVYTDGTSNFTVNNYVSGTAIPVTPSSSKTYSLVSVTGNCGTAGTGLSGAAVITVSGTAPDVVLASPGTDIAAASANTCTGSISDPIYNFQLSATTSAASVTQVNFTTTGTHTGSDITNYKLWYNATANSLTGATQIGSSITTATGAGSHSFAGLTQSVAINTTGYFIITTDIAATSGHTIQVTAFTTSSIVLSCVNTFTGSANVAGGGTQTISGSLTVTPTSSLNPVYYGGSVTLNAGVTTTMSGTTTYSWSSVPAAFSGTASTSTATLIPTTSPVTATVTATNGYCSITGTIIETVSIPYSAGTVNAPPATGYSIPGSIYGYNYNTGTATTASAAGNLDYNDADGTNNGGQYRATYGVDIENQSNGVDTYDLGWVNAGEWQAFTVNVAATGSYNVSYTVGTSNNSTGIKLQDVNPSTNTATDIPNSEVLAFNTGGTQVWATASTASPITLTAGIHTIRVYNETGNYNYTKVTFTCAASTAAVLSGTTAICNGNTTNLAVAITGGGSPYTVVYTDGSSNFTVNNYVSGTAIPVSPTSTKTYSLVSVTSTCGSVGTGLSGTAIVTVSNTPPNVVLASPSPNLAAANGNTCKSAVNDPVYNFQLSATTSAATVTQVNFTTSGTHTGSDITNYRLWYNAISNSLTGAAQVGSSITSSTGAGAHAFTNLTQSIAVNTTGYFIITADIASGAGNHTIQTTTIATGDIILACMNSFTGSASGAGIQTIASSVLTVTPTSSLNPAYYGNSVTLSAGITGGSGSQTYSWSSIPAAFTGIASTATATLTPTVSPVTATVTVTDGYCIVSGTVVEAVSIPYVGYTNGSGTLNANASNLPTTSGYAIPGIVYVYNYNTGTAPLTASTNGALDYADGDAASNGGGNYRANTGVDFENNGGVYNVSNTGSGEFLAYTVNITNAGTYNVTFSVANGSGAAATNQFKLQLDGVDITTGVTVPNTAAWATYQDVVVSGVAISTTGIHTLKLVETGGTYNIRSIAFACPASTTAVLSTSSSAICSGGSANLSVAITGGSSPFTVIYKDQINTQFTVTNYVSGTAIPVTPSGNTTYTLVSVTGSCGATGTGLSGTPSINVTAQPSATVTYSGSPFCSSGAAQTVTQTGTTGGAYSSTTGLAINSASGTITPSASIPGTYTVTYTVAAAGGCAVYSTTTSVTIALNTWTGAVNTNWSNAANWSCNTVPAATDNVIIPASANPVLSADVSVYSITWGAASSKLTLNGHRLTIDSIGNTIGYLVGSPASNLSVVSALGSGTVYFDQSDDGTTNALANLTIHNNSGATTTLGNKLNIYTDLNVQSGILDLNGVATVIKSTATNTASVDEILGTLTGAVNVTVERYIPANSERAWRLLSVPTSGNQTFNSSWQEGQTGGTNNVHDYGTIITASTANNNWAATGFDYQQNNTSILSYNQGGNNWAEIPSMYDGISTTSGYFLYIRGDRTQTPASTTGSTTPTTLRTNGTLYQGTQSSIAVPSGAFGLIGNVYASAIDFTGITRTGGVDNKYYVWDPKLLNLPPSLGAYVTMSAVNDWVPIPGVAGVGSYGNTPTTTIESGQAFFVHASSNGAVTLNESNKVQGSNNVFRPAAPAGTSSKLTMNVYAVSGSSSNLADGNVVVFNNDYLDVVDGDDALKLSNTEENFAIARDKKVLAIEARQPIVSADTIFYNMWNMKQQQYRLEFIPSNFNAGNLSASLVDNYLGTRKAISLTSAGSSLFTIDGNAASAAGNRFEIVLGTSTPVPVTFTQVAAIRQNEGNAVNIYWKVEKQTGVASYEIQRSTDGVDFTTIESILAKGGSSAAAYSFTDAGAASGVNYYRIVSNDINGNRGYASIVKVAATGINIVPAIAVSPNPVTANFVNIELINQPAGVYGIRLLNMAAQVIYNTTVSHGGGSSTQRIIIPSALAAGIYKLEVLTPDKKVTVLELFIK